ncbi:MAG: hypothetical protein ABJF11_00025, partial [Reichenbachiella sp.]|uniref:hypothetical protein n=1 Tax=Reichenbachiella sp. TaxID=2184521 RepID=UPI00326718F0
MKLKGKILSAIAVGYTRILKVDSNLGVICITAFDYDNSLDGECNSGEYAPGNFIDTDVILTLAVKSDAVFKGGFPFLQKNSDEPDTYICGMVTDIREDQVFLSMKDMGTIVVDLDQDSDFSVGSFLIFRGELSTEE